jgi:hypothetical protein
MEKITDKEFDEIRIYYQKEAETTATIGRLTTELYLLQERTKEIEELLLKARETYINDNRIQLSSLKLLLEKHNAKEINTSTGELIK